MAERSQNVSTPLGQEFALAVHGFVFQCFNVRTFRECELTALAGDNYFQELGKKIAWSQPSSLFGQTTSQ